MNQLTAPGYRPTVVHPFVFSPLFVPAFSLVLFLLRPFSLSSYPIPTVFFFQTTCLPHDRHAPVNHLLRMHACMRTTSPGYLRLSFPVPFSIFYFSLPPSANRFNLLRLVDLVIRAFLQSHHLLRSMLRLSAVDCRNGKNYPRGRFYHFIIFCARALPTKKILFYYFII